MTTLDSALLESVEKDYFDDPRVMALVDRFRCAQSAQIPPLPKTLHSMAGNIWCSIAYWADAEPGQEAVEAAEQINKALEEELLAYAKEALRLNGVNAMAKPIIETEIKDDKPVPPPEAQTEAEKIAYCAGWWAALEAERKELLEITQAQMAHAEAIANHENKN